MQLYGVLAVVGQNYLQVLSGFVTGFTARFLPYLSYIDLRTVIDILAVAFVFYKVLTWIKGTRAIQLLKGLAVLVIASTLSERFQLYTMSWLLEKIWTALFVALPVVFQPELRRALEQLGRSGIFGRSLFNVDEDNALGNKGDRPGDPGAVPPQGGSPDRIHAGDRSPGVYRQRHQDGCRDNRRVDPQRLRTQHPPARRGGDRLQREDAGRSLLPAVDGEPLPEQGIGHQAPLGHRHHRAQRCGLPGSLRGDRYDLPGRGWQDHQGSEQRKIWRSGWRNRPGWAASEWGGRKMAGDKRENWLVRYNVGYKILAVCLAFLLWYFVAGQRDPLAKQTYNRPVELRPTTTQLVSTTTLPEVTITVSGTKDLVQSLQEQDIHAYVDVSGQTAGVYSLPIQTSVPDNIQVLSIYPQSVLVSLDYQGSKKLPVKVVLQGTPAPGFTTLNPEVTPGVVTVSGPSSLLGGLQEVQAVVNTSGVNINITTKVSLQVSEYGDRLELNPKEADVVVPVVSSGLVKNVPVIADIRGTPGLNQVVKSVAVDPTMVALTGPQGVLTGLVSVYTQPVDISGATDQVVEDLDLVLPQGVSLVTPGQVHVTVDLGAAATGAPQQSQ